MVTIEKLKAAGANVEEGLQRCMGNEALYLKLVNHFMEDTSFEKLKVAIQNNDLEESFKLAHGLKGVLGNLSLTPLFNIIFEMTELLRHREERDYSDFIKRYEEAYALLK